MDADKLEPRALYAEAAKGLLAELASIGYDVKSVGLLSQRGVPYVDAIPVLTKWLPLVTYMPLVEEILDTLAKPFASKYVASLFLDLFVSPPHAEDPGHPNPSAIPQQLRSTVGSGLQVLASPRIADGLINLAQAREYGLARTQIVESLPKTKDPRVPEVLLGLLDDPSVAAYAATALGKLRWAPAQEPIEALLGSDDWNTRTEAKKALKRIDLAHPRN